MRTTVVCGLLGSGKTTFIKRYLRNNTQKAVVLVNDFGQTGIDGEIFSADGIEAVELPSGCVCCTLKFDLITTLQKIVRSFSPEHLIIEPSGVASPSAVLEAVGSAGIGGASVIGIVDAVEFAELYESGMYGSFFQDQIVNSDVILVNKTDLAGEAAIAAAERMIGAVNPLAVLLRTVDAEMHIPLPDAPLSREIQAGGCHLRFDTLSFRFGPEADLAVIRRVFEEIARGDYGRTVRAKALVGTNAGSYRFDSVHGKIDMKMFGKDVGEGRMVVIGEGLDREAIERAVSASL